MPLCRQIVIPFVNDALLLQTLSEHLGTNKDASAFTECEVRT